MSALSPLVSFGVLKNEHPLVYCNKTSSALFPFIAKKSHWRNIIRAAVRKEKQMARQHFVSSQTDNTNVSVEENGEMGLAVFATMPIKTGTRIAVFEGETYRANHALDLPKNMRDHAIQTGPKSYVFGYRGLAHCLCHSCDPNCGIRNLTEIFAIKEINAGEALTWDYRCSENSNWVLDTCLCGSERCTKTVKNYDSLSAPMKAEYHSKNMVSEWLCGEVSHEIYNAV